MRSVEKYRSRLPTTIRTATWLKNANLIANDTHVFVEANNEAIVNMVVVSITVHLCIGFAVATRKGIHRVDAVSKSTLLPPFGC